VESRFDALHLHLATYFGYRKLHASRGARNEHRSTDDRCPPYRQFYARPTSCSGETHSHRDRDLGAGTASGSGRNLQLPNSPKCSTNLKERQPASNNQRRETPPEKGRRFPEKTRLIVWDVEAARYAASESRCSTCSIESHLRHKPKSAIQSTQRMTWCISSVESASRFILCSHSVSSGMCSPSPALPATTS
jgi:hypothetical protein